jgi:hypothetical protein
MKTQNQKILEHLDEGKKLTALQALKLFGCMRLSGRIYDLRSQGYDIGVESYRTKNNKTVARYYLKEAR